MKLRIFSALLFAVVMCFFAKTCWDYYRISGEDFMIEQGTLANDAQIQYSYDEYSGDQVSGVRFHLKESKEVLSIPGHLLSQMDQSVLHLKKGTQIRFLKSNVFNLNALRIVLYLEGQDQVFLKKDQALAFYNHPKYLLFALIGSGLALLSLAWILKKTLIERWL